VWPPAFASRRAHRGPLPRRGARAPRARGLGRLFPEKLARKIQDAYAYKRGIANRFFTHTEQTQITDTEDNHQPYLIDFGAGGSKWVTVAEPFGRAFAVNAIFLTDTITGKTEVWRVPRGTSLTGNRRALETVRSVSIPGFVFSDQRTQSAGGGRFRIVEPRPAFVAGRLVYLISIIPESANSVSKTVIVDAARNKLVTIFDNDSDPEAEAKTLEYLRTGVVPGAEATAGTDTPDGAGRVGGHVGRDDAVSKDAEGLGPRPAAPSRQRDQAPAGAAEGDGGAAGGAGAAITGVTG
jgi:hypothetical protein